MNSFSNAPSSKQQKEGNGVMASEVTLSGLPSSSESAGWGVFRAAIVGQTADR
jgi:hypothetical protein